MPAIPTGSSGSPDRSASSAAPSLNGEELPRPRAGLLGKDDERAPAPQARQRRVDEGDAARRVSRSTGTKPAAAIDQPRIGRRKRLRLARKRTDIGRHGQQHEDVGEALVVGAMTKLAPASSRSAWQHARPEPPKPRGSAAPTRGRSAGTSRRAAARARARIAGRPKRTVATAITIQTPRERRNRTAADA